MSDRELLWIDGELVPVDSATLSPFDHGLTVGDGVFETMRIERGEVFAISRHLARLHRSADALGLDVSFGDDELRAGAQAVVEANGSEVGRVRLTLTSGIGPLGSDRSTGGSTVIIATAPARAWQPAAAVVTVPWRRNEHSPVAGIKTTSYAENVVALRHAHERGAVEALFANTVGDLCEGTGTNVFVVVDGRLLTPPLSSGCLAGVTRELLLEITDAVEEDVPFAALTDGTVAEAFLSSSTRDVQPIERIDEVTFPAPGPHTATAAAAFADLVARTTDP